MRIRIPFDDQRVARALCALPDTDPAHALAALELPSCRAIVVVHGGASAMASRHEVAVQRWAVAALAPLAEAYHILVVDGGTDVGTARALGAARQITGGTFPLLGVLPRDLAAYPGGPALEGRRVALNAWHSHFLLVEGSVFGVESPLMVGLLQASGLPGLALVVNGGRVVLDEAQAHAARGSTLVVLCGSGRAADVLAQATSRARAALPPDAHLEFVEIGDPEQFSALLDKLLLRDLRGGA